MVSPSSFFNDTSACGFASAKLPDVPANKKQMQATQTENHPRPQRSFILAPFPVLARLEYRPSCHCNPTLRPLNIMKPLKNGFAAAQKYFPLRKHPAAIMINDRPLMSSLERRKTFDSPLANHFSAVMQNSQWAYRPAFFYHGSTGAFGSFSHSMDDPSYNFTSL